MQSHYRAIQEKCDILKEFKIKSTLIKCRKYAIRERHLVFG